MAGEARRMYYEGVAHRAHHKNLDEQDEFHGNSYQRDWHDKNHYHKGNLLWEKGGSWTPSSWQPAGQPLPPWKWNALGC